MADFRQAKHYTATNGRQIDLIVIHDMEAPEGDLTAENVARYFATTTKSASAHWCFDNNSAVRCVLDKDVAYHAPGANHNGIGYEHAGYAKQSREEWLDQYGVDMLQISANQAAFDCTLYQIPINYVSVDGLLRGERGITTHWDVSKTFRRSSHWDPGLGFPMDMYLNWVRGYALGTIIPPSTSPVTDIERILRRGSKGEDVRLWQTVLHGAGLLPKKGIDGIFGPNTENATKEWQRIIGVSDDGIVGPITNETTARVLAWVAATQSQQTASSTPPFPGTVSKGSRGSNVSAVQDRLRNRGWSISVDGIFGNQTDKVVRAFQKDKGLKVDGIVGPKTWDALWTTPIT